MEWIEADDPDVLRRSAKPALNRLQIFFHLSSKIIDIFKFFHYPLHYVLQIARFSAAENSTKPQLKVNDPADRNGAERKRYVNYNLFRHYYFRRRRRREDLNLRGDFSPTGFRDQRFRPLSHASRLIKKMHLL